jgi:4-hydroxythreonine-4-phosphate dehydrogenase
MGEPGGIGPLIAQKARAALATSGLHFCFIGDAGALRRVGCPFEIIDHPADAAQVFSRALPLIDIGADAPAVAGVADPRSAPAVIGAIERGVEMTLRGDAAALVTCPIQKSSLIAAGFAFPGHTEFLEYLTRHAATPPSFVRGAVMMLAGPGIRTVPVTIHQSVADAARGLSVDAIIRTVKVVVDAMRRDFGIASPLIEVSGLNPHAGEDGAIGLEDRDIIAPAIATLRRELGVDVTGPHAADSLFSPYRRRDDRVAVCMLHDQALIPVKTLCFDEAVNVTLGLPIVRTSPDHGTALDLASRPDAMRLVSEKSLVAALIVAAQMAAQRALGASA